MLSLPSKVQLCTYVRVRFDTDTRVGSAPLVLEGKFQPDF
jgi:hypothetical protein